MQKSLGKVTSISPCPTGVLTKTRPAGSSSADSLSNECSRPKTNLPDFRRAFDFRTINYMACKKQKAKPNLLLVAITVALQFPGHEYEQNGSTESQENLRTLLPRFRDMENGPLTRPLRMRPRDRKMTMSVFFFPRLAGAEMCSRLGTCKETPARYPHYQLQHAEHHANEGTQTKGSSKRRRSGWNKRRKRFFISLSTNCHLYRGTAGTEVAYLLRLLLMRLGISPGHPKLRVLASSASLEPSEPQKPQISHRVLWDETGNLNRSFPVRRNQCQPLRARSLLRRLSSA